MGTSIADGDDARFAAFGRLAAGRSPVPALQVGAIALAIFAAYYVGALLGLELRFPPATSSLLWPPNAILTAALLLTRSPRRWALYLAAAFPAHLAMLPAGWNWPFALALFATNCSEALIAAIAVRALSGAPVAFDTLRRMGFFIGTVVLLAPFASSFLDAAVVHFFRGEPYGQVWRNRFVSNTLTELMVVPAAVAIARNARGMLAGPSRRWGEASALVAFTLLLWLVLLGMPLGPGFAGRFLALLFVPVLWAALRFGPASTAVSLLAMGFALLSAEVQGRSLLGALPPAEAVRALQTVLAIAGVPLMFLAALMQEHRKAEELVTGRLDFQRMLADLSTAFVPLASHEMEATFERSVARIGESLEVDRLAILLFRPDDTVDLAYSWSGPGVLPLEDGADAFAAVGARDPRLGESLEPILARHSVTVPMLPGGRPIGMMSVVRSAADGDWPVELVERLRLVAGVLAGAFARRTSEDALRRSESMKSAILASIPTSVAVLDRGGRLLATNDEWARVAKEWAGGGSPWELYGATADEAGSARARGVAEVLDGALLRFEVDFVRGKGATERWIHMSAVPLRSSGEGGAVVSYSDVTEHKRAEIEAAQSRQELAHFLRVSSVGVMTTSLAHELNQPLTAILANAQAAQRMLAVEPLDLAEFHDVLADVIEEDKRAGEIIGQLREMLRNSPPQRDPLDVVQLVSAVARLASSDALMRDVKIRVELDPETPGVRGDRTQVQQVVLNLLLNALEAAQSSAGVRAVLVRAAADPAGFAEISVRDTGEGIPADHLERVFEPFYTTKAGGMGMGLSIARSIVSAHGGAIWAEAAPGGGALFRLRLPPHVPA